MDDTTRLYFRPDNPVQNGSRDVRDDLRIYLAATLQDTEYVCLSSRAPPRLPRTLLGPKYDSSTSTVPHKGVADSHSSAIRSRTTGPKPVDRVAIQARRFCDL